MTDDEICIDRSPADIMGKKTPVKNHQQVSG